MTASTRWRAWLVAVAIAAALLGGALLARMGPALSLALTLALPGAESWLAPLHAEVVVEEMSIEAGGRRLVADLYRPSAPRGGLLLVHGLSRAGRRHPERSEEHTSELQSRLHLVCRLLLEKKKK